MKRLKTTPKKDGFRMPGEFEKHAGTYILWPQRPDNWRYGGKPAQKIFVEVANTIAKYEPVTVLVNSDQYVNAKNMLGPKIRVVEMSNNDSWVRDSGPSFVINDKGATRGVDWGFNAYGGLVEGIYYPWDFDDLLGGKICDLEWLDSYDAGDFILEGGSIHVDGEGTCITTEECLLAPDRNPNMTKEEIENHLKEYLNVEKVLWIPRGVYKDEDTNGHVDNMCNFVKPGEVVLAWCDDKNDPQYERSVEAYEYLSKETDAKGRKLKIHKLSCPAPLLITEEESGGVDSVEGSIPRNVGDRMAGTYVNYYTGNGFVALPIFNDPNDKKAVKLLQELYPDRKIETIYAREILLGGGNIHCITQQLPSGKQNK